jgi:predicted AAA+ superfamily ATPase
MIPRPVYMKKLSFYKDKDLIKVITGLRRSGKSTLLGLYRQNLLESGVSEKQIISINFEDPRNESISTHRRLYEYVMDLASGNAKSYVFLDEVQQVESFEKAINGLYLDKSIDIHITGSNAWLLSGELATLLSGRYIEIPVFPLSFKEYVSAHKESSFTALLQTYMKYGGLPYTLEMEGNPQALFDYLGGVYNTVVRKDIVTRLDAGSLVALDAVTKFLFDNIGNFTSAKKISDTLTSSGVKISTPTVSRYVAALCEAYVLSGVSRYDLKGKRYLQTQNKYYLTDSGLRYYLLGDRPGDLGHLLENVVYLELLRRNCRVAIGKAYSKEIDFVATDESGVSYYQVAASVLSPETLKRELDPLRAISDNYPKFLLTLDEIGLGSHEGIQQINVIDWLLRD